MQIPLLACQNISFERDDQTLFPPISFNLAGGESLQVMGANGSGKSTLLRILTGLIENQTGDILWLNKSIKDCHDLYQDEFHYLGHRNGIQPLLTVKENLQLTNALLSQTKSQSQVDHILENLHLEKFANKQAMYLSAGLARRLALAKLLLKPASIWFLDEPTTALDKASHALFLLILNTHLENGNIAVIATHQDLTLAGKIKKIEIGVIGG